MSSGASLWQYIARRLITAIPLIFGVLTVNFIIIQLAPGDPLNVLLGEFPAPQEYIDRVRTEFGLDKPAWQQFLLYIWNMLQGDLGFSFVNRQPVLNLVMDRLVSTAMLTGTAMLLAAIIGVALGVAASLRPYSFLDSTSMVASLVGYSLPVFWLGQVLVIIFALKLGWLPTGGMHSLRTELTGLAGVLDTGKHLILPVTALLGSYLALNTRMTRTSMLEVLTQDYVRTARAKGLHSRTVLVRHALRNALIPIITTIIYNFGYMLSGSALVETVFAWPGIGRLMYDSISTRDYPVMMGIFIVIALMVITANLLTDVIVATLDPRIRF